MDYEATPTPEDMDEPNKILILPGATEDLSAATYCIIGEDHTLGNLLRWMIMKNPAVEFCGYSAPHPSEEKIHIRIQTYDGVSSLRVLHDALNNCEDMTEAILAAYKESLANDEFERPEEIAYDFESVNDRLWAQKEAAGLGTRAEFEESKRVKAEADAVELTKIKGKKSKAN